MSLLQAPSRIGALVLGTLNGAGVPVPAATAAGVDLVSGMFQAQDGALHVSASFQLILAGAVDISVAIQGSNVPDVLYFSDMYQYGQFAAVVSAAATGTVNFCINAAAAPAYLRLRIRTSTIQAVVAYMSVS